MKFDICHDGLDESAPTHGAHNSLGPEYREPALYPELRVKGLLGLFLPLGAGDCHNNTLSSRKRRRSARAIGLPHRIRNHIPRHAVDGRRTDRLFEPRLGHPAHPHAAAKFHRKRRSIRRRNFLRSRLRRGTFAALAFSCGSAAFRADARVKKESVRHIGIIPRVLTHRRKRSYYPAFVDELRGFDRNREQGADRCLKEYRLRALSGKKQGRSRGSRSRGRTPGRKARAEPLPVLKSRIGRKRFFKRLASQNSTPSRAGSPSSKGCFRLISSET